jgi:hydroxymethylbilane synthase
MRKMLRKLECEWSARVCSTEQALLKSLQGDCNVPIGVETEWRVRRWMLACAQAGEGM